MALIPKRVFGFGHSRCTSSIPLNILARMEAGGDESPMNLARMESRATSK
jgi:hypothetical protein